MLDIRFVRENPDVVKENIRKKFQDEKLPLVDEVVELDAKRRAAIAGVIAMEPDVLILDEPTAGLDPAGRESILKNIRDYQAAQQAAVVMVSHSMEEIASNVDRLIVMEKGTAVMTDAPSEVFSHAAELVSMGLNVPCMTQVLLRLQQLGVNVPASAYTVEQAADLLEPLLKGGAQIC